MLVYGVIDAKIESHNEQPLLYTIFGTACSQLPQCLGRLSLPPSVGL